MTDGARRLGWDEPAPGDLFNHLLAEDDVPMTTPCLDAKIGEPHGAHAHVVPTGEGPGVSAVVWCGGMPLDDA